MSLGFGRNSGTLRNGGPSQRKQGKAPGMPDWRPWDWGSWKWAKKKWGSM